MGDLIVIGILLTVIGLIIYANIKKRKNGSCCSGCSCCSKASDCMYKNDYVKGQFIK